MVTIEVDHLRDDVWLVSVSDERSTTRHEVTVTASDLASHGVEAERLLEASFRFLLDREPKESILRSFELPVISRYFPEYPDALAGYLNS